MLALFAYPFIIIFVFDWFGKVPRWARVRENRGSPLPPSLRLEEEHKNRFLIIGKYALLLVVLRGLAGKTYWNLPLTTRNGHSWATFVELGLCGGLLIFGFRRLLSLLWQGAAVAERNEYYLRGPIVLWFVTFLVGGFAEEIWRAICISSFQTNDFSSASANLLTALTFSIAHISGLPSRVAPGVPSLVAETMIGLLLGGLFIWSGNLTAPYFASVTYFALNFFFSRGDLTLEWR
jgi:membrane protease YdiL (CAAX protease family)